MVIEGFVLRKTGGMNVVVPIGSNVKDFHGALMLNDTGAFIFERLKDGKSVDAIAADLTAEYAVALEKAISDTEKTIAMLLRAGVGHI